MMLRERDPTTATYTARQDDALVIAVMSGKGGVGKSNIAINLGLALRARGERVILVDAGSELTHADVSLNIPVLSSVLDAADNSLELADLLAAGPRGLAVIGGVFDQPGRFDEPLNGRVEHALQRLRRDADVVMIDCGTGVSAPFIEMALSSDVLILATTPEPAALADTYAVAKRLAGVDYAGRLGLVVSMSRSRREAHSVRRRFSHTAMRFLGVDIVDLGDIPHDRHVFRAVRQRQPVLLRYPHCAASHGIERICSRLPRVAAAKPAESGMWARVAGMFL